MDTETIVGIAITLLAALMPFVVPRIAWHRARRRATDERLHPWRPEDPGGPAPRESDTA